MNFKDRATADAVWLQEEKKKHDDECVRGIKQAKKIIWGFTVVVVAVTTSC